MERRGRHSVTARPLLADSVRPWTGAALACCAVLVVALGALFAHQTQANWLDHAVDSPIITWLESRQGLTPWLAAPGSQIPAVILSMAIAIACLLVGRLNGAALAAAAVPVAVGLNDGLLKPLVHRTYLGILTYPSGHTAAMFALASTVAMLLLAPPQRVKTRALRVVITGAACMLGCIVAIGVIGLRWHYFTDTVAGAAVGIGTVCALALLLDVPTARRQFGRAGRLLPTGQPKASV